MAAEDSSEQGSFWIPQGPLTDKVCAKCKERKPLTEFRKITWKERGYQYPSSYCRSCAREYGKVYIRKRRLKYRLATVYRISPEIYEEMLVAQNGVCAICGLSCKRKGKLSVDHCHKSKKVRGLLCDRCNNGLGHFDDSIELLKAAIAYLDKVE